MILLIDNYDSFVYNLAHYLAVISDDVRVERHDALDLGDIERLSPELIVISPGPGAPADAGISLPVIEKLGTEIPIFGVCLGHQAIGEAFGARVVRAKRPMHGKCSTVRHDGRGLFRSLPQDLRAVRYHSLVIDRATLPDCLEVTAAAEDGEVMGVRHRELPIEGVQFHPESIFTEHGPEMVVNAVRALRTIGLPMAAPAEREVTA